jgi:hypothetical protein
MVYGVRMSEIQQTEPVFKKSKQHLILSHDKAVTQLTIKLEARYELRNCEDVHTKSY